jgi:hypothetical protein
MTKIAIDSQKYKYIRALLVATISLFVLALVLLNLIFVANFIGLYSPMLSAVNNELLRVSNSDKYTIVIAKNYAKHSLYTQAIELLRANDIERVKTTYNFNIAINYYYRGKSVLDSDPNSQQAILSTVSDWTESLKHLKLVIEKDPSDIQAKENFAYILAELSKLIKPQGSDNKDSNDTNTVIPPAQIPSDDPVGGSASERREQQDYINNKNNNTFDPNAR